MQWKLSSNMSILKRRPNVFLMSLTDQVDHVFFMNLTSRLFGSLNTYLRQSAKSAIMIKMAKNDMDVTRPCSYKTKLESLISVNYCYTCKRISQFTLLI